jgi:hypothetical protein
VGGGASTGANTSAGAGASTGANTSAGAGTSTGANTSVGASASTGANTSAGAGPSVCARAGSTLASTSIRGGAGVCVTALSSINDVSALNTCSQRPQVTWPLATDSCSARTRNQAKHCGQRVSMLSTGVEQASAPGAAQQRPITTQARRIHGKRRFVNSQYLRHLGG